MEAVQKPHTPESDVGSFSDSNVSELFVQAVVGAGDSVELVFLQPAREALAGNAPSITEKAATAPGLQTIEKTVGLAQNREESVAATEIQATVPAPAAPAPAPSATEIETEVPPNDELLGLVGSALASLGQVASVGSEKGDPSTNEAQQEEAQQEEPQAPKAEPAREEPKVAASTEPIEVTLAQAIMAKVSQASEVPSVAVEEVPNSEPEAPVVPQAALDEPRTEEVPKAEEKLLEPSQEEGPKVESLPEGAQDVLQDEPFNRQPTGEEGLGELPEPIELRELQLDASAYAEAKFQATENDEGLIGEDPDVEEKGESLVTQDSDIDVQGADWMRGVRRLLAQETAALPATFKGKLNDEDLVKALGLEFSRRSHPFADASGRQSSVDGQYVGTGLETPPSPPAPSSDRSRHSEPTPVKQASLQMVGGKERVVPAVGLKSSPMSSDDNRISALARLHQAEVPMLDFARVHMGEEDDDTDETGNGVTVDAASWDGREISPQSFGVPPINMTGLGQDFTIHPEELVGVQAMSEEAPPERPESRLELLEDVQPPENSHSSSSKLPREASVVVSSGSPGGLKKATAPVQRSPFEIPLYVEKRTRPTPRDLSVVRLPPVRKKPSSVTGSRSGSRTKKATKGMKPISKPLIAHVHSHFHHHYHVFSASQASALGVQTAEGNAPELTDA